MTRLALCVLMGVLAFEATASARTWLDKRGGAIEGLFIRVQGQNVVLQRGTKVLFVPLASLCEEDQEFIRRKVNKSRGKANPPSNEAVADDPPPGSKPRADRAAEDSGSAKHSEAESTSGSADDKDSPIDPYAHRTWTDDHGNKMTAALVKVDGSTVILRRNGLERGYPFGQFTPEDRVYLVRAVERIGELTAEAEAAARRAAKGAAKAVVTHDASPPAGLLARPPTTMPPRKASVLPPSKSKVATPLVTPPSLAPQPPTEVSLPEESLCIPSREPYVEPQPPVGKVMDASSAKTLMMSILGFLPILTFVIAWWLRRN